MSDQDNADIKDLLSELVVWTRFANLDRLIATLRTVLADERHAKAYELSDGKRSQVDVAKLSGLSQPAVSGLWARWKRLGIVDNRTGRARHLVRPSDLGLAPETDYQT